MPEKQELESGSINSDEVKYTTNLNKIYMYRLKRTWSIFKKPRNYNKSLEVIQPSNQK